MSVRRWLLLPALLALASCIADASARSEPVSPQRARIVSLVPSMTEDLFAVGAGKQVVAVSEFTDYPPQAKHLPIVASFASIDTERIVALHPDLCIGIEAQDRLAGDLRRAGIPVYLRKDDAFDDIFANLDAVGTLSGHRLQALALVKRLRARTAALVRTVPHRARKPSVFVVLGVAPIYTVGRGSYIERLIELAGGRNAAADVGQPYARFSAEALIARQPDLIVADPDVGLGDAVLARPPWKALRAVRHGHLYRLPDAAILERPGPRYNLGLAWLIAAIDRATR